MSGPRCIFFLGGACCHHRSPSTTCVKMDERLLENPYFLSNSGLYHSIPCAFQIQPQTFTKASSDAWPAVKADVHNAKVEETLATVSKTSPASVFDALFKGPVWPPQQQTAARKPKQK